MELLEDYYVETRGSNTIEFTQGLSGTISSVKVAGIECYDSYDAQSGILTLSTAGLPTAITSMGKNKSFVIVTDEVIYTGKATLCTMTIYDTATLDGFMTVAKSMVNPGNPAMARTATGYFLVTQNFTYTNEAGYASPYTVAIINTFGETNYLQANIGFTGVFDGQGCVIDGFKTRADLNVLNGLFGSVSHGGDVGNIVFTNARHQGGGSFIAWQSAGYIHDIYIQGSSTGGLNSSWEFSDAWITSRSSYGGSVVRNIFVDAVKTGGNAVYSSAFGKAGTGSTYTNCFAIGTYGGSASVQGGAFTSFAGVSDQAAVYVSYSAMVAAKNNYSGFTHPMWILDANGVPYPAALI